MTVYSATIGRDRISFQFEGCDGKKAALSPIPPELRFIQYPNDGVVSIHRLHEWASKVGMELKTVKIEGGKVTVYGTGSPGKHPDVARVWLQIEFFQFARKN